MTTLPTALGLSKKKAPLLLEWAMGISTCRQIQGWVLLERQHDEPVSLAPWGQVCCSGYTRLHISLQGPLSRQTGMSSLSFCVGQEEHVTLVIMSVNSEAAKESGKRRPRGSRQSLKHEALEIISLPEVPAVTPWLEGHNCWKQLVTNSLTAKGPPPPLSSLPDLPRHEGKGANRGNHARRHGSRLGERTCLPPAFSRCFGSPLSICSRAWILDCCCLVAKSCPILCDPLDRRLPGFSVQGISQVRILEWVAISFSRASSRPRKSTTVSRTGRQVLHHWATREALNPWYFCPYTLPLGPEMWSQAQHGRDSLPCDTGHPRKGVSQKQHFSLGRVLGRYGSGTHHVDMTT